MKRKLVRQGRGSHTIALPHEWIRKNGLTKDDHVQVVYTKNGLIVRPEKEQTARCDFTIQSEHEHSIRAAINLLYRFGYQEIVLRTSSEAQQKIIQNIVNTFFVDLGYTAKDDVVTLVQLETPEYLDIESCQRKMIFLSRVMLDELVQGLQKNALNVEAFADYKSQHNQLDCICRRLCVEESNFKQENVIALYLSGYMQLISHSINHFVTRAANETNFIPTDTVLEFFSNIQSSFVELSDAILAKDVSLLTAVDKQFVEMLDDILAAMQARMNFESVALYYAGELVRLMHIFATHAIGKISFTQTLVASE